MLSYGVKPSFFVEGGAKKEGGGGGGGGGGLPKQLNIKSTALQLFADIVQSYIARTYIPRTYLLILYSHIFHGRTSL